MKNSILKNTNINKLSKNEYHVYTLLNKYKNDDTNLLISSYLAGNTSADLYNTINKNLYNKLKNNDRSSCIGLLDISFIFDQIWSILISL